MPRKLKEIDVEKIALCSKASTGKTFYITKEKKNMEELIEILKSLVGEETITDEGIARLKTLSEDEESLKVLKGSLDIIESYMSDELPDDYVNAVKTIIKKATFDATETKGVTIESLIEKSGATLSKATAEQIRKIIDICQGLLKEKEKDIKKFGELPKDVVAELEELQALRKEKEDRIKKEASDKEKKRDEKIEELEAEIEKLKKTKGTKKSIDGQDEDTKKVDEDEDPYHSLAAITPGESVE